jgi:hypothetical protein
MRAAAFLKALSIYAEALGRYGHGADERNNARQRRNCDQASQPAVQPLLAEPTGIDFSGEPREQGSEAPRKAVVPAAGGDQRRSSDDREDRSIAANRSNHQPRLHPSVNTAFTPNN